VQTHFPPCVQQIIQRHHSIMSKMVAKADFVMLNMSISFEGKQEKTCV